MLLAVDIGNTNVVFGIYDGKELKRTFRVSSVRGRTADELGVLLHQMLTLHGLEPSRVDAAILASVVPPLTDTMAVAIHHVVGHTPLIVSPTLPTGITVLYDNPRDVGADRIVNAVAAFERVRGGVIVVDFGTATTFDCVSPKAEYLGGVIVPGIQVSLDALLGNAAKLTRIEIAEAPKVVGQNTTHAIQSGVVNGYASLVDGLIDKIKAELGFPCAVMATGGLAGLISRHTRSVQSVDEHLTLDGLRILHERNRHGAQPSAS
ncbi:MAG: type III pantothenate kinase [Polyangiaceae bacterium]